MTHDEAFLQAILEAPDDDTPRLIYADWLDDQGDPRGEFIRVQCRLARLAAEGPGRPELEERHRLLYAEVAPGWPGSPRDRAAAFAFCRRLLRGGAVPVADYLAHAAVFRTASLRDFHVDLTGFEAPPAVVEYCPESVARENLVLPLALHDRTITFALHNPNHHWLIQTLQFIFNMDVEVVAAPALQLAAAIERHYTGGVPPTVTNFVDSVAEMGAGQLPEPGEGVVAGLVNVILDEALGRGATAVWLGPQAGRTLVRYRIGGDWVERDTPPGRVLRPMIACLREMAAMGGRKAGQFRWRHGPNEITVGVRVREKRGGPRVVLTVR
jgi:uncharacterized protein (TIGR02996 family)